MLRNLIFLKISIQFQSLKSIVEKKTHSPYNTTILPRKKSVQTPQSPKASILLRAAIFKSGKGCTLASKGCGSSNGSPLFSLICRLRPPHPINIHRSGARWSGRPVLRRRSPHKVVRFFLYPHTCGCMG